MDLNPATNSNGIGDVIDIIHKIYIRVSGDETGKSDDSDDIKER
jgi:hypothetical protein